MGEFSWVTLATNDSYSLGALVLAHSLKRVGTRYQLVVMVTPGVTQPMREKLAAVFDLVFEVNILDSKDERNLLLLQRPELGITFTKLHCWRLTQFKKCVFLDADTLVLQNCDELFERDEFSAAPDVGWPDCFNSGVFVYAPSDDTFNSLLTFALERGSFDGGDQGLLNLYFSDWAHKDISKHLPFIYNMCSTACYSYLPAFKQFGENVKIVHFIGNSKPWLQYFNSETLQVTPTLGFNHLQMIFDHWWNLFCSHVHSNLAASMARIDQHIASSCTSSSHSFTHSLNESKCEDSLDTAKCNTEINIPIWDPWENYNPIYDNLENTTINSNTVVVDNNNETPIVHIFHETNEFPNNSNSSEQSVYIDSKSNFTYDVNSSVSNNPNQSINNTQNSNNETTTKTHYFPKQNNHIQNVSIENKYTVYIPPSPPSPQYVHSPVHIESSSIPIFNNEANNPQNACTSCQTVKSATEQPNNTVTESGNTEKGTEQNGGLAGAFAQMTLREPKSESQGALEDHLRRQGWEAGRIDYLGQDSFDNVWKKICETISAAPVKESSPPKQILTTPIKQPSPPKQVVEQVTKQPSPPKEQTVKETSPPKQVEVLPSAPVAASELTQSPVVDAPVQPTPAILPTESAAPVSVVPSPELPVAPVKEAPTSEAPAAPAPVAPTPDAPTAPASEAPVVPAPETPVAPAPETPVVPAPETPVVPAPETPVVPAPETPVAPAPGTPVTPAPEAPTTEVSATPTLIAPILEAPVAPVLEAAPASTPEAQAVSATEPTPETVVAPVEPTPVPATTTPTIAAELAAPVAATETIAATPIAATEPVSTPPAVATESVTTTPAPVPAPVLSEPAAAPEPVVPAAAPEPVVPAAAPVPAVTTAASESVAAAVTAATPEAVTSVEAPVPETVVAATKTTKAPKQTKTKAEEQKPKEAKPIAATEKTKPACEIPQATAPPAITETPATPQTPDAAKGEIKPEQQKSAEGQSSETPQPPPRKVCKKGTTSKKSSKKN